MSRMSEAGAMLLLCGLTQAACSKDEPPQLAAAPTASASVSVGDSEIKLDLPEVGADGSKGGGAEMQPPPQGVFAPGQADRYIKQGAALKLDIFQDGGAPKSTLWMMPEDGSKHALTVEVGGQMDGRPLPMLRYELSVAVSAPKAKEGESSPMPTVTFVLDSAKSSAQQAGRLPAALQKEIAKLKGSKIIASLSAYGSVDQTKTEMADGVMEGLALILDRLAMALSMVVGPMPTEPVGVGAYWMARDRARLGGVDVLRYRVTRVESVSNGQTKLKMDVKHYAATSKSLPSGAPEGLVVSQFQSQALAELVKVPGQFLPVSGQINLPYVMAFTKEGQAGRGGMRQSTTVLQIVPQELKAP
jgi:hypothetical protein